jgi:hypothetical protein
MNRAALLGHLDKVGVRILKGAAILSIETGVVSFELDGSECELRVDATVDSGGWTADPDLFDLAVDVPVVKVGDALAPGRLFEAVHSAAVLPDVLDACVSW